MVETRKMQFPALTSLILFIASVGARRQLAQTQPPPETCVAVFGQCGGGSYTGPTCCEAGAICSAQSIWYSQCVPVRPLTL